jgi:quinol monooxygenase YgiN
LSGSGRESRVWPLGVGEMADERGMEEAFEAFAREVTANTLSQDTGCLRYEWYRADTTQTYILIER